MKSLTQSFMGQEQDGEIRLSHASHLYKRHWSKHGKHQFNHNCWYQRRSMLQSILAFLLFANQNISPAFAVTGGEPVKPHEFPFLVSFYKNGPWSGGCGGALITKRHVLTCKHCFVKDTDQATEVGFGKTARANDEGVLKVKVQRFVFHPQLDLAILVLDAEVPESDKVKIIGLPEVGSDYRGQNATLAGPGGLSKDGPAPEELMMKVSLKVGSEAGKECSKDHICATSLSKQPWGSGCGGDSGSPLFVCSDKQSRDCTVIAVIVGPPDYNRHGNCQGDSFGPSVSALRPWIDEKINNDSAEEDAMTEQANEETFKTEGTIYPKTMWQ